MRVPAMSGPALIQCPSCGTVGYPRKDGRVRKHDAKPDGVPRWERPDCPGSGQPGTPVERTR